MLVKFYAPNSYKRKCMARARVQHKINVNIDCIPGGTIVNSYEHGFGVFDGNGNFIDASRQMRGKNCQFIPKFVPDEKTPFVDADVIYFGNVYPHFGHFLLEHMNRAYGLLADGMRDLSIVLVNNQNINPVPKYIYDLLDALGVSRDRIIILNETKKFRKVYIPHQSFNIPFYYADEFSKPFEYMAARTNGVGDDKIYVSRAKLKSGRTYGEEGIQQIFAKNGFRVIYPETMPLVEQISFMKNCRVLAGCAGTALHLALFMPRGGTVIQIKRNRISRDNFDIQNMINSVKNFNSYYVAASVERVRTSHSTVMPQIIGLTKYMKKFFDDNNFAYSPDAQIPNDADWREYRIAMEKFKAASSSPFIYKFKDLMIKLMACFIIGRERRGRFRKYMKTHWRD